MTRDYTDWAKGFKNLKQFALSKPLDTQIAHVIEYYKQMPPEDALRDLWSHDLGYRKNNKDGEERGEQEVEKLLLGQRGSIKSIKIENGKKVLLLYVTDHNFAMANQKSGQVICDAFGFIPKNKTTFRPVAIEVKVTDGNPWYAVVENLIQVRLARTNLNNIEQRAIKELLPDFCLKEARGACGLIVAPKKYYSTKKNLDAAKALIAKLIVDTEARIMLATSDSLTDPEPRLTYLAGYWPKQQPKP